MLLVVSLELTICRLLDVHSQTSRTYRVGHQVGEKRHRSCIKILLVLPPSASVGHPSIDTDSSHTQRL